VAESPSHVGGRGETGVKGQDSRLRLRWEGKKNGSKAHGGPFRRGVTKTKEEKVRGGRCGGAVKDGFGAEAAVELVGGEWSTSFVQHEGRIEAKVTSKTGEKRQKAENPHCGKTGGYQRTELAEQVGKFVRGGIAQAKIPCNRLRGDEREKQRGEKGLESPEKTKKRRGKKRGKAETGKASSRLKTKFR